MPTRALIFDIQDLSVQDGPGIRTTVFMKGCPLKCLWCSNPEGQKFHFELMHIRALCNKTYNCISACPYKSVSVSAGSKNNFPDFDRDICNICKTRECIDTCPSRALKFVGKAITVEELLNKVKSNIAFYKNSGGGVTFSGGEPFLQVNFIKEFLLEALPLGLSVGVETCGMFDWRAVKEIAYLFDFFYYDLKCLERNIHLSYTGMTNDAILSNLENLSKICSEKITVSVPLIPGFNDTEIQMKAIGGYCSQLGIKKLRLLPYHSLGESKYNDLGRKYLMEPNLSISPEQQNDFKNIIADFNINVVINE